MRDLLTLSAIRQAASNVAGIAARTPLVHNPAAGGSARLLLKPESIQPTGAFKLRGAYAALSALAAGERQRGVVTHSSGNHAQALAYAARMLGMRAVVVAPDYAPASKLEATRALGAELVLVDGARDTIAVHAEKLAEQEGHVLVPPYDNPDVMAGQGTIGLEIVADAPDVDVVVVPVGGGGLIAGVATAVKKLRPEARVVGVEPELAADAQESLRTGSRVAWPEERTRRTSADGLRVGQVGELTFPHMRAYVDDIVTVTEEEIRAGIRHLATYARLVAEPSGAATTAAYLFHSNELPPGDRHVAVVSGGNIDPALLAEILGS